MCEAAKTTGEMMGRPSLPPPVPLHQPARRRRARRAVLAESSDEHPSESAISKKEVHDYLLQNHLA